MGGACMKKKEGRRGQGQRFRPSLPFKVPAILPHPSLAILTTHILTTAPSTITLDHKRPAIHPPTSPRSEVKVAP